MIDILQLVQLRPEVQKELAARYRLHGKDDFDKVAGIVRGAVTNGHSGPPPDMIDRMPKLEIIASASVGYDGIPVEYARTKGIPVCNTPDVLNDDVADLAPIEAQLGLSPVKRERLRHPENAHHFGVGRDLEEHLRPAPIVDVSLTKKPSEGNVIR